MYASPGPCRGPLDAGAAARAASPLVHLHVDDTRHLAVHEPFELPAEGLAGGLYGVSIGGLFAAESMYHVRTDASKAAFVALVERLRAAGDAERRLLDLQWQTPHLERLGAVEITRGEYRARLAAALRLRSPWQ